MLYNLFRSKLFLGLIFSLCNFFWIFNQGAQAGQKNLKFAVINMQKLTESSNAFQDIKKKMEEKAKLLRDKFEKRSKDLRKKQIDLENEAKLLKPQTLNEKNNALMQEGQGMNEEMNIENEKLRRVYVETMNKFQDQIQKCINDYSKKNDIDVVLETSVVIFFNKNENFEDITDKIKETINKDIKSFEIKFD